MEIAHCSKQLAHRWLVIFNGTKLANKFSNRPLTFFSAKESAHKLQSLSVLNGTLLEQRIRIIAFPK